MHGMINPKMVSLFVCLYIYVWRSFLSIVSLSLSVSLCRSVSLSLSVCLSDYLCLSVSVSMSRSLSVTLSRSISLSHPLSPSSLIFLSPYMSLPTSLSVSPCLSHSVWLCVCFFLHISVSPFVSARMPPFVTLEFYILLEKFKFYLTEGAAFCFPLFLPWCIYASCFTRTWSPWPFWPFPTLTRW